MTAVTLTVLVSIILTAMPCKGIREGKSERCLCLRGTEKWVKPALVKTFEIFPPSASCSNTEIIITLKRGRKLCLDPKGKQGKRLLLGQKPMRKSNGGKSKKQMKRKQQN